LLIWLRIDVTAFTGEDLISEGLDALLSTEHYLLHARQPHNSKGAENCLQMVCVKLVRRCKLTRRKSFSTLIRVGDFRCEPSFLICDNLSGQCTSKHDWALWIRMARTHGWWRSWNWTGTL